MGLESERRAGVLCLIRLTVSPPATIPRLRQDLVEEAPSSYSPLYICKAAVLTSLTSSGVCVVRESSSRCSDKNDGAAVPAAWIYS